MQPSWYDWPSTHFFIAEFFISILQNHKVFNLSATNHTPPRRILLTYQQMQLWCKVPQPIRQCISSWWFVFFFKPKFKQQYLFNDSRKLIESIDIGWGFIQCIIYTQSQFKLDLLRNHVHFQFIQEITLFAEWLCQSQWTISWNLLAKNYNSLLKHIDKCLFYQVLFYRLDKNSNFYSHFQHNFYFDSFKWFFFSNDFFWNCDQSSTGWIARPKSITKFYLTGRHEYAIE